MQMSETGRKKLAAWEGLRSRAYRDAAGKLTIGVGHLLTKSELSSGKIWIKGAMVPYAAGLTDRQVLDLLGQDLEGAENAVNEGVEVELRQPQFDALVSFCFNVGAAAFKNSTLLRRLNQGGYEEVPGQLRRWVHCNGAVVPGLVKRREQEIACWQKGLDGTD